MTDTDHNVASRARLAPDVEAWLRAGAGDATCEKVIETSISWIYLFPDRALKLKKPVDLGFLDFSTVDRRRWAAERELAFNRPGAPDIYRAVRAITRGPDGALCFDGPGPAVEWVVEMRRFDEAAVLANHLDVVDGDFAERLGRMIGAFHLKAGRGAVGGGAGGLNYVLESNAHLLRAAAEGLGPAAVEALLARTRAAFEVASPLLDRRLSQGFVRCCHGDLHLGNILLEAGAPILFDCIEFNDRLREIDVLYDVAFLLMDLGVRGANAAANRVLNGWLDAVARESKRPPWEGLAALPLFQSVRAAVRAHVNGMEGKIEAARGYLRAATEMLETATPRLVAIGGLSGSGKSTLARSLAPGLGGPPGAVILRSDEVRKRLWGRAPTERLPPEAYRPAASAAVYAEIYAAAGACLDAGRPVILDAVFLDPRERGDAEAVARSRGLRFDGVWLEAPVDVLRGRIDRRRDDASDADAVVLERQLGLDPGVIAWARRASSDARAASADLDQLLNGP